MLTLTLTLLIVGSFALLAFGLAARGALRRNPCPSCARSSLRWSGARLVRARDGSTVDVVERGHCRACAATIFQSHQNGWWRATTTDEFPPSLAFTTPLAWRDSRHYWGILDRARAPISRLSGSPRSTSLAAGIGLIAGFACLTVGGLLIENPKVKTSTVRLDDIPPSVFQSSAPAADSIMPVDTAQWYDTSDWNEQELLDDSDPADDVDPPSRMVASIGVQVRMSSEWREVAHQAAPYGTVVGFMRPYGNTPTVLTIAAVRPALGVVGDEMLETSVRAAITEASAGAPADHIKCARVSRGQHCAASAFEHKILGWGWTHNGRAYLVIAMVPMDAPNLYERMDEVFELVGSITPVI